ncbi:MAG: glycosyltransferase family 4 protein, partial [Nanoarchaeota archaeon]
ICVSNATKKDLLNHGIKPERAITIYNGFDYDFWKPKKNSKDEAQKLRKEMGLDKKFVCISWGRPGESKGFQYLLEAASLIREKIPHAVILLMLGSPEKYKKNYQKLKKMAKRHQDFVKIIPSVPYQKLGIMIRAADCVVVPSLAEGFGYSALETISLGTPLVASDAGSLPEVVSGKHLFFESKNSEDLAEKIKAITKGEWNYLPLKKFEWDVCIELYLEVYSQMVNKYK